MICLAMIFPVPATMQGDLAIAPGNTGQNSRHKSHLFRLSMIIVTNLQNLLQEICGS
jgi:hypothetical protein